MTQSAWCVVHEQRPSYRESNTAAAAAAIQLSIERLAHDTLVCKLTAACVLMRVRSFVAYHALCFIGSFRSVPMRRADACLS